MLSDSKAIEHQADEDWYVVIGGPAVNQFARYICQASGQDNLYDNLGEA